VLRGGLQIFYDLPRLAPARWLSPEQREGVRAGSAHDRPRARRAGLPITVKTGTIIPRYQGPGVFPAGDSRPWITRNTIAAPAASDGRMSIFSARELTAAPRGRASMIYALESWLNLNAPLAVTPYAGR
jgi:hypothetical protein